METVSVEMDQVLELGLTATPEDTGRADFTITVSSGSDPKLSESVKGALDARECRDVDISITPSEITTCSGDDAVYTVSVKNLGTTQDTFDIVSSLGTLEKDRLVLGADETKTIALTVGTGDMEGAETVTDTAESEGITDQASADLVVEKCYSAEIIFDPAEVSICPFKTVEFGIELRNTGKLANTYTLRYADVVEEGIMLNAGESRNFAYSYYVTGEMEDSSYYISAKAESERFSTSANATLDVKNLYSCYSTELVDGNEISVEPYKAVAVPIKIVNRGENPILQNLEVEGPNWIHVQPDSVSLDYNEERTVYLYVSPPHGTHAGSYTAKVKAISQYGEVEHEVEVHVVGSLEGTEGEGEGEPAVNVSDGADVTPEDNETDVIRINISEGDITLNISYEGGEGVTGEVVEAVPLWKTVVVGVITLVIIIILVIRFAFLVKE